MAAPVSGEIPSVAYARLKQKGRNIRNGAISWRSRALTSLNADELQELHTLLHTRSGEISGFLAVSGIVAVAKVLEDDPNLELDVEYTALVSAIDAARDHIETAFPESSGYKLTHSIVDHVWAPRVFSSAQLSTLAGLLQDIVDATS